MKFSITGTRNKLAVENNLPFIASMLEKHIMEIKPIEMYFGGALGIDMAALLICKEIKKHHNLQTQLITVLPNTLGVLTDNHVYELLGNSDVIIPLNREIKKEDQWDAYHKRNDYLIDKADLLIGFPLDGEDRSGTMSTIRKAKELEKYVAVYSIKESKDD